MTDPATADPVTVNVDVPAVGDVLDFPHGGYMGAPAHWRVVRRNRLHDSAYEIYVEDVV